MVPPARSLWLLATLTACDGTAAATVGPPPPPPLASAPESPSALAEPAAAPESEATPEPAPRAFLPPAERCRRRGRRRYCDGPRRVLAPTPAGSALAERHGIGTRRATLRLLGRRATPELLADVGSMPEDTLLWPVPEAFLGRGFGRTREGALAATPHRGVDLPAAEGSLVRAANDGLVVYADNGIHGYGNLVVLLHGDDSRTLYAHLEAARVGLGDRVARGQALGSVGRTGLARAPHLHFEHRVRAVPRDPTRRFAERPTHEDELALMRASAARRAEARARLEEWRARAARRAAREAAQAEAGER